MRLAILLLALAPAVLRAQKVSSPIMRSLYLALGSDPMAGDIRHDMPRAVSVGVEQSRANSRWAFRLGTDYMRTTSAYGDTRREELAAAVGVRYGRRAGTVRPYLLAAGGIASLRVRGKWIKYDSADGVLFTPVDSSFTSTSRWNGVLTPGFGADIRLGRVRLFTEARLNIYPRFLSDRRTPRSDEVTKALFIGVKL